jgi:hypothetical protein
MAVRIIADSLAMTARSSAAVLHARTLRMRSRSFIDMVARDFQVWNVLEDGDAVLELYAAQ